MIIYIHSCILQKFLVLSQYFTHSAELVKTTSRQLHCSVTVTTILLKFLFFLLVVLGTVELYWQLFTIIYMYTQLVVFLYHNVVPLTCIIPANTYMILELLNGDKWLCNSPVLGLWSLFLRLTNTSSQGDLNFYIDVPTSPS